MLNENLFDKEVYFKIFFQLNIISVLRRFRFKVRRSLGFFGLVFFVIGLSLGDVSLEEFC